MGAHIRRHRALARQSILSTCTQHSHYIHQRVGLKELGRVAGLVAEHQVGTVMVQHMLADARKILHDLDTMLAQLICRTNTGKHEHMRRMDCASSYNHLLPRPSAIPDILGSFGEFHANSTLDTTKGLDQDLSYLGMSSNRQVWTSEYVIGEVCGFGGYACAVRINVRHDPIHAQRPSNRIEIRAKWYSDFRASLYEESRALGEVRVESDPHWTARTAVRDVDFRITRVGFEVFKFFDVLFEVFP